MNILIADDHKVFFLGLSKLLRDHFPDAQVLEAINGDEIHSTLQQTNIDVILLDIRMPGVMTLDFVERLHGSYPKLRIVVLSMLEEYLFGLHFIRAGAKGFINKQVSFDVLIDALKAVLNNNIFYGRVFTEQQFRGVFGAAVENPFRELSRREVEVMNQMFEGYGNKEIAEILSLSPNSVSTYKTRIFEKLGTTNIFAIRDLYQLFVATQ